MPILDLQMRMRQLGEIRLGHVVPTKNGKTRPAKLDKFRFTSPSREILTSVAGLYGGEVKPWTPANGGPRVRGVLHRQPAARADPAAGRRLAVVRAVRRVEVPAPLRRRHRAEVRPAVHVRPRQPQCKITTRVNVMLRDVPPSDSGSSSARATTRP
jgi:hypothetical protein